MTKNVSQTSLFPTDLPGPEWVEFEAKGYSRPVTGVIFRDAEVDPGVPLGGLGTGAIALGTDGTLNYYSTIFNAFLERDRLASARGGNDGLVIFTRHRSDIPSLKLPFLGLTVGDKTYVLSLKQIKGIESARQIHYWGHYPVADLEYEIDAPIAVNLRAWAPFFPRDGASCNVPGAVFQVCLRNTSGVLQRGSLGFSFHGPRREEMAFNAHGLRQPVVRQVEFARKSVEGAFTGVTVDTNWEDMPYSYALGAAGVNDVRIGGELTESGWNALAHDLPTPASTDAGATVAIDFSLQPGKCRIVNFVLSWYAPYWRAMGRKEEVTHNEYLHMYTTRFQGVQEVAAHLAMQHDALLARILAWQEVIYSDERLPIWLRDALINVFAVLPQESFWLKNLDPNHWWGEDGLFCVNESLLSCPQQSCIANDEFGEWPLNIFFPDLARNKLRQFKHYQRRNGQVPSTLGSGTEPDQPWYDQQLPMDGMIYIHMVDRYWQVTGEDDFLEEYYASVKAQLNFMKTVDQDEDGLIDVAGSNQYYDNWPTMAGAAVHVSGYWLATLRIVERMAAHTGDNAFAEDCRSWIERGSRSMEEKLWNQAAESYLLFHQPETGKRSESVLSDQLIGQWFTHLHGVEGVFPANRVKSVLETVWRHNITPHGVRIAIRPDGGEDTEGFNSTGLHPSYSTHVPSMVAIYEGNRTQGMELMHRVWHRLVIDLQMAWDMPGGLTPSGFHRWGLEYYHNTMLCSFPVAVLGHTLKSFCAPGELVDRVARAAKA